MSPIAIGIKVLCLFQNHYLSPMNRLLLLLFSLFSLSAFTQSIIYTDHNRQTGRSHHFAFVHLTDTHIGEGDADGDYGTPGWLDEPPTQNEGYSAERLRKAVQWINAHADSSKIRFVIVTGDLTDSGERSEFLKFKEIMDGLRIPYIPLIGNHDVWPYTRNSEAPSPCGDSLINTIFVETYARLAGELTDWDNGTRLLHVRNPERKSNNYLQNFSFSYNKYRFLLTDFGTRQHAEPGEKGVGPQADLHNFTGGTLPWVKQQLEESATGHENVFLFTHWPATKDPLVNVHLSSMAFGMREYQILTQTLYPYRAPLALWFSGHIHRDRLQDITRPGETEEIAKCLETAANKKFVDGHFRVVRVWD